MDPQPDSQPPTESSSSEAKPPSLASQRIADLNAISTSIFELLAVASTAIRLLTTPPDASTGHTNRTEAFTKASQEYHALLSSITVRLRRQILLLEQAEIPLPTDEVGGVDVGALNERNDVVGREMERELWSKARGFLDALEAEGYGEEATGPVFEL